MQRVGSFHKRLPDIKIREGNKQNATHVQHGRRADSIKTLATDTYDSLN